MVEPTLEDCAYAAGVLDSDGCITILRNKRRWMPRVRVTNLHIPLLFWFQERWYGSVFHNKGARGVPEWVNGGKHLIINFLHDIQPYLQVKADQAQILLDYFAAITDYRGKSSTRPDGRRPPQEDQLRERFRRRLSKAKKKD